MAHEPGPPAHRYLARRTEQYRWRPFVGSSGKSGLGRVALVFHGVSDVAGWMLGLTPSFGPGDLSSITTQGPWLSSAGRQIRAEGDVPSVAVR